MFEQFISQMDSQDPDVVKNAITDCGLAIEMGMATDAQVEAVVQKTAGMFDVVNLESKSAILWILGKTQNSKYLAGLRFLFPKIDRKEPGLVWQWLVSYENLAGAQVLDEDIGLFGHLERRSVRRSQNRRSVAEIQMI